MNLSWAITLWDRMTIGGSEEKFQVPYDKRNVAHNLFSSIVHGLDLAESNSSFGTMIVRLNVLRVIPEHWLKSLF